MTRFFDPWAAHHVAHRTPDEITRCLRESTAALMAEKPQPRPGHDASLDIDPDRPPRGGKSRAAVRAEWRPLRVKYQDGGVSYNGGRTWGADDE